MMQTSLTEENIEELLISFLRRAEKRAEDIQWMDWLPLAEATTETPELCTSALNRLRSKQQYALINLLRQSQSGPLPDIVLTIFAANALAIEDEQVRQIILKYAQSAYARHQERLQALRDKIMPLAVQVQGAQQRLAEEFDCVAEIARLEARLAEIRCQENDQDEKFARVHALERDILCMETRKILLTHYDEAERSAYLQQLTDETLVLEKRNDDLDKRIGQAIGKRDTLHEEVQKMEKDHHEYEIEQAAMAVRISQLVEGIAQLKQSLEKNHFEAEELAKEHSKLIQEVENQSLYNREAQTRIAAVRKQLEELQAEARESGLNEIDNSITQLFAMLPQDCADRACR